MSGQDKSHRIQIIAAVIGLVGALGAAVITNWHNLFPKEITKSQNFGPEKVSCTGSGQVCSNRFAIDVTTRGFLKVQYVVPPTHCGPIKIHFYLDGERVTSTDTLGWRGASGQFSRLPLTSGKIDLGPVSSGNHSISLEAEGETAGCNRGQLNSWLGNLQVWTSVLDK
ncbi:MAG: hypothetical protein F6K63_20540 [Moorea sp. SIO1G6]|uniref:hypothetical protein n=1 Tax=unclassified Moorena TaxID=2683338 RepID=UPI0013B99237|nr:MULTISPECIES: hypothetical protein [unclassified Moorena]NEQ08790.1 hypothetical protein [Moorena sp. SIO4E2]NET66645.1 hypothetical protein [Moorena sp. SIO1G6]